MTAKFANDGDVKKIIVGDSGEQKALYDTYVEQMNEGKSDYKVFAALATEDLEAAKDRLRTWLYQAKKYHPIYWEGIKTRAKPQTRHFDLIDANKCWMGVTCELSLAGKCVKGQCTINDWRRCGGIAFTFSDADQDEFLLKVCKGIDGDITRYTSAVDALATKFKIGEVDSVTQTVANVDTVIPLTAEFGEGANRQKFEFPAVTHTDNYQHIVFRVTDVSSNKSRLRWAYKSQSGGGWRVSPGIMNKKHFMKGWDYTHLTKPSLQIEQVFTAIPEQARAYWNSRGVQDQINEVFDSEAHIKMIQSDKHNILAYSATEVKEIQDSSFFEENQGNTDLRMNWDLMTKLRFANISDETRRDFLALIDQGFRLSDDSDYWSPTQCKASSDLLRSPSLRDFIPDTTQDPVKTEPASHTLIGDYNLYHYNASLGDLPIRWTLGAAFHGGQMKVWVHKVYFRDEEDRVNSYGLYPTNIGPGLFNNKPFDYVDQSMGRGVNVSPKYNDMTSILPQGIPFLNTFVRNITNDFREEALRQITLFETVLKQSTATQGQRRMFRVNTRKTWMGHHSWQHYVVEKVMANPRFTEVHQFHKDWCKYLFQQIVGLSMGDQKKTWSKLKAAFEKAYTISVHDTVQELEYAL